MADDPAGDPPPRDQRDVVMQRVRVGLTGLAAVFLLTLLAASIFNMLGQDEHSPARMANGAMIANNAETPKEPLAELGMAPGNAPKPTRPASIPTVSPPAPTGPGLTPLTPARKP